MINSYHDEEGNPVVDDLPEDYDQVMQELHDEWENSSEARDAYNYNNNINPGGSLLDRYNTYHDMAVACNEEPVSFDEWLDK